MLTYSSYCHWNVSLSHDDVIKWKHCPRYWPFVWGIHRSPVNSPHKGQWRGALMFSFICVWINGWVNNRKADDFRRYRAHCDVTVMSVQRIPHHCGKWAKGSALYNTETETKWSPFYRRHAQRNFLNEDYDVLIQISLNEMTMNHHWFRNVALRQTGNMPLSEPMMASFADVYRKVSNIRPTLVGNIIVDQNCCRRCSNYSFILNLTHGFNG